MRRFRGELSRIAIFLIIEHIKKTLKNIQNAVYLFQPGAEMDRKIVIKLFSNILLTACFFVLCGCGPGPAEQAMDRGIALAENGQNKEALAEFTKAIEIDSKYAEAYFNRATVYKKEENKDAAIADYTRIIEINPDLYQAYNSRGFLYAERRNWEKAFADYDKALEINNFFSLAYYNRAMAYYAKRDYAKALEDARKADALGAKVSAYRMTELQDKVSGKK